MSAGGSIGMVLDRALTVDLLDVALRVATEHRNDLAARQLLGVALRDLVTPQEAENKTKKVLTRVWVAPPANAQPMIGWAIEHQDQFADRRALHYGALLATFPFFGSIAAAVGRQIHIDGAADRRTVRTHARVTFGEREFIDAGASKSLRTMRNLGLLDGLRGWALSRRRATARTSLLVELVPARTHPHAPSRVRERRRPVTRIRAQLP